MELPVDLNKKIVEYLTSLPNIHDKDTRRALVLGASLDAQLKSLLNLDVAGIQQFSQQFVHNLVCYGELADGRDPLEAVLNASKQYVGVNRKQECDLLIQEWQYHRQKGKTFIPGYTHDILVIYAFRDNRPASVSDDGWVTKFMEDLRKQLNQKLGGSDSYALCTVCLDQQVDGRSEITPEIVDRLRSAATLVIILSRSYVESYIYQQKRNDIARLIKERTRLHSNVFLIEPDQLEDKDRPPEFCGLQSYQLLDKYGYTNRLYELSCDLTDKLQKLQRDKKSAAMIRETFTQTSSKPPQTNSDQEFLLTNMAFINANQVDGDLGDEIAKSLTKDGMICIKPLQGKTVSENRSFFEETVTMCEFLIIVYGRVRPQWVLRQVGEVLRISGQQKHKIIYDGPPEQKSDLPVVFPETHGIHILVCHKGICKDCEAKLHHLIHALH